MTSLADNWLVHSLGWTLLHFCWQGALVEAVLWASLQLLARRSSRARYAASCCALGLLIAFPLATFSHIAAEEYRLAAANGGAIAQAPGLMVQAGFGEGDWFARAASILDPAMPWVMLAWLAGSALFLFRLSVGFSVTRKLRSLAISQVAPDLQAIFNSVRQRLNVAKPVLLMHSALVQVPTVIGWLRPVVLIPASCFTGLPSAQIEAILCHELAHICRHDYLVSVVQSVVEALLFYHPAVWWVSRQLRHERECCCDDIAVAAGGDALAYARALTTLAQRSLYPQMALGANGGVLTMRIKRLLIAETTSAASQLTAAAVLALVIVLGLTIGAAARAEARSPASATPAQAPAFAATPAPIVKGNVPRASRTGAMVPPSPAVPEQQPGTPPVRIAGGVAAVNIAYKVAPEYPAVARAAHVQGAVTLHALISKTGDILNLQVIDGPEMLRASALDAVRQWRYKPYLLNGEPTEVDTTITVNYSFNSVEDPPALPDASRPTQENDAEPASLSPNLTSML